MSEPERSVPLRSERQSSEAALVAAARLHDEAAVRELIRRLNGRLFRIARGLMPSDAEAEAEEVVQDAWLAAFTHLDGFRDAARFSTWITRIMLNCAAMRLRKQQARQEYDTVNEPVVRSAEVLLFPGTDPQPIEAILGRMQTRALIEAAVGEPAARPPAGVPDARGGRAEPGRHRPRPVAAARHCQDAADACPPPPAADYRQPDRGRVRDDLSIRR